MDEYVFSPENPPPLMEVREDSTDQSWRGVAQILDVWVDEPAKVTALIWDYEGVIEQTAPWTELVVIVAGNGKFEIDGKTYELSPGDFVVWPEGMHGVMTTSGWLKTICVAYPFIRSKDDYRVNILLAES